MRAVILAVLGMMCQAAMATFGEYWNELATPVYEVDGRSVQDATMARGSDGSYAIFYSGFYIGPRDDQFRCHVVGISTTDFQNFSEPFLTYDGVRQGWKGMCSPNVYQNGPNDYILTFNSWGDLSERPNQLFYTRSRNLLDWTKPKPLAASMTSGERAIDAAVAFDDTMGEWVLIHKQGLPKFGMATIVAHSPSLDGNFVPFGDADGIATFTLKDGTVANWTHENFGFFKDEAGDWWTVSSDYNSPAVQPITTWIYRRASEDWLTWDSGQRIDVPIVPGFNTKDMANAGFVFPRTKDDPYYYLLFAGTTERTSFVKRGNNKLALARSPELTSPLWELPPN